MRPIRFVPMPCASATRISSDSFDMLARSCVTNFAGCLAAVSQALRKSPGRPRSSNGDELLGLVHVLLGLRLERRHPALGDDELVQRVARRTVIGEWGWVIRNKDRALAPVTGNPSTVTRAATREAARYLIK